VAANVYSWGYCCDGCECNLLLQQLLAAMCSRVVAGISGYVAANMYKKMGGENWVWNINLTSALFAGLHFFVCPFLVALSAAPRQ